MAAAMIAHWIMCVVEVSKMSKLMLEGNSLPKKERPPLNPNDAVKSKSPLKKRYSGVKSKVAGNINVLKQS
jgi:hypothetical protein